MKTTIQEVVEQLRHVKDHGKKCSLLIGAGCSVTAGVPTAQGFVDLIQKAHPFRYERAPEKTYGACMKQLPSNVRRDLVAKSIDDATGINWAHVGIAQLVAHGYVDRIFTTNFDPLILRACALVNQFPAVYDFAAATQFVPDMVPSPAVFHLHGQRSGFVLLNTPEELTRHAEQIKPVFQKAGEGRMWIVVGYSGENDPLVDLLVAAPHQYGIYWVGYKDNEPAASVRKTLTFDGADRCWVPGYEADGFFVELTQRLGCFPPDLVGRPFSHLAYTLKQLTRFTLPGQAENYDPLSAAKESVERAIADYEVKSTTPKGGESRFAQGIDASAMLMAGQYDEIIKLRPAYESGAVPSLQEPLSWAYVVKGNSLAEEAKTKTGAEADRLFGETGEKYAEALRLKPDMHEALNNWGAALYDWARTKTGAEADRLFAQAGEKYAEALRLKPDMHDALNNWGNVLSDWAKTKTGAETDRLFGEAGEKYAEALRLKPDMHEALTNWGAALSDWAKTKTGAEADRLFAQAGEKYAEAVRLKPDKHAAFNNWGAALSDWARTKTGAEADRLFAQASEKYAEASDRMSPTPAPP
ncbi:SIR2 family protein, partial [Pyxidicoccus sp. 3LFB2]